MGSLCTRYKWSGFVLCWPTVACWPGLISVLLASLLLVASYLISPVPEP